MNKLFINNSIWNKYTADELEVYKSEVFNYYRTIGFPYFKLTDLEIKNEINKLKIFNTSSILQTGDILKQVMLGLNFVNYYMPHMWETKCHGFSTPMNAFLDDSMFKKAIKKRIDFGSNMSDAGMRKALSWVSGTHRVSNFRPTIAKWIYDNYSGDGNVLDFSSGYGGRLFGALSSDSVKSYTGAEPYLKTYDNLIIMSDVINSNKNVIIHNKPFEDLELEENYYDLSFSSPPYFNTEEYSYESTQSFMRYKTKESWKIGFLTKIIENNYKFIKRGGYFIINIANVKTYKDLETDTIEICKSVGFELIRTYKMSLSALMSKGFKYEPIFIFKKI